MQSEYFYSVSLNPLLLRGAGPSRGGRGRKKFPVLEPSVVLTHGGPPRLRFELQTNVHKNKFLFISVLSVLLVLVGPYWSWWALGFSQVRFMDITALPK